MRFEPTGIERYAVDLILTAVQHAVDTDWNAQQHLDSEDWPLAHQLAASIVPALREHPHLLLSLVKLPGQHGVGLLPTGSVVAACDAVWVKVEHDAWSGTGALRACGDSEVQMMAVGGAQILRVGPGPGDLRLTGDRPSWSYF